MNHFVRFVGRDRLGIPFEAQHAVKLRRPREHLPLVVVFPASHVRELFGLRQQGFAPAQPLVDFFPLRNILGESHKARDTARGVGDWNRPRMEQADAAVRQHEAHFRFVELAATR
jgi:hypothetical protein